MIGEVVRRRARPVTVDGAAVRRPYRMDPLLTYSLTLSVGGSSAEGPEHEPGLEHPVVLSAGEQVQA